MIDFDGDGHIDAAEEALFYDMVTGDDENECGACGSGYSSSDYKKSNSLTGEDKFKIFLFVLLILYSIFVHN
ncbi:hypothetical protein [Pseudobutyrivibrio ruminis]|uniref:EF-hand domain-containing protein n=1 Tax=Pseudobutyrivibrio ruminis DSM 9787 TaxID=1123011 RepID=A0A285T8Y6_9FIRM|nr:hypothetical protein [Pseudobutyrivibrio ruminis]SOC17856.1 hypothetical protein SAMN02910411_0549 [Pseudobutyrivibrio ruminis DSM 9787]